jgi:hypothetical protein
MQIVPQAETTQSAFFPITPAPTRLVVNYARGGDVRELSLELPGLAGLHLKAPQTASAAIHGPVSTL